MRVHLTIALLFCFFLGQGQDQDLRRLLIMPEKSSQYVDSISQLKVLSLKADERRDSIPGLLETWRANCEPNEALIRVQLLNDFEQGYEIVPLSELVDYILEYHNHLRYQELFSETLKDSTSYKLLQYTQNWADSLLADSAFKNKHEEFMLKTLAAPSAFEAEHLALKRAFARQEKAPHLQRRIREQSRTLFGWELGLLTYHYQAELSRYLEISPAIHLGIGVRPNEYWDFLLFGQVGFQDYKRDLRIYALDSAQNTRGNHSLTFGLQVGYKFVDTKNYDLKLIGAAGYDFLDVGVDEERVNTEGETYNLSLGLHSYNMALGLQNDFRLWGYRHLGVRATYHFTDYNLGTRALNDLSGGYFAIGLVFH